MSISNIIKQDQCEFIVILVFTHHVIANKHRRIDRQTFERLLLTKKSLKIQMGQS